MNRCLQCGGKLRRLHRSFTDKFVYLALYRCQNCRKVQKEPRPYTFRFGKETRCPRCGTPRIRRLSERDHIDPFHPSLFAWLDKMLGAKLYHCRYCRVQFYDHRDPPPKKESKAKTDPPPEAHTTPQAS